MSENNGGNNGLAPQPHGGALRTGGTLGNKGGTGRPKNEIRDTARRNFDEAMPLLEEIKQDPEHPHWKFVIETLVKVSGLQQTDVTSGDAPVKSVVIDASTLPTEQLDAILASE